jgi:hypothetical protein
MDSGLISLIRQLRAATKLQNRRSRRRQPGWRRTRHLLVDSGHGHVPLGAAPANLYGFFAFGEALQAVRIAKHDALPAALDETFGFPGAENPADSVQRRPRHFGDILTADRKVDLDPGIDLLTGLLGEAQQRMRHPLLHVLVRDLDDARLRVLQPAADRLKRARRKRGIFDD